jgi:hypothetical protein
MNCIHLYLRFQYTIIKIKKYIVIVMQGSLLNTDLINCVNLLINPENSQVF